MQIKIQTKTNNIWDIVPTPIELTEKMALLKQLAGTETIITITTDKMTCYLCGTEALRKAKQDQVQTKGLSSICMDIHEAHTALENNTETFLYAIQAFSTPGDVRIVFPDKPEEYKRPSEGWDHLKRKERYA